MIPVPSGAFFKRTEAEPNFPVKSWVILLLSSIATEIRCLMASSLPLRIASGISVAFPRPAPTWPFMSPTTTRAVKRMLRPPFTTLVTRLMETTFSVNSIPLTSMIVRLMLSFSLPRISGQLLWPHQLTLRSFHDIYNRLCQTLRCQYLFQLPSCRLPFPSMLPHQRCSSSQAHP